MGLMLVDRVWFCFKSIGSSNGSCYLVMCAALVGSRATEGVVPFGVMSFSTDERKIVWKNFESELPT